MNKEDIKKEYVLALREKFSHTSRPYEDIAGWALNDFITDYIVKKLSLYGVVKQSELLCECCGKPFKKDICNKCADEIAEMQGI